MRTVDGGRRTGDQGLGTEDRGWRLQKKKRGDAGEVAEDRGRRIL